MRRLFAVRFDRNVRHPHAGECARNARASVVRFRRRAIRRARKQRHAAGLEDRLTLVRGRERLLEQGPVGEIGVAALVEPGVQLLVQAPAHGARSDTVRQPAEAVLVIADVGHLRVQAQQLVQQRRSGAARADEKNNRRSGPAS